jgi:hypothetical protein
MIDSPNSVPTIFKLSRSLSKPFGHILTIGKPGSGKREYLQLTCLLLDGIIIEPLVKSYNDV